jgi:hypothetical protein
MEELSNDDSIPVPCRSAKKHVLVDTSSDESNEAPPKKKKKEKKAKKLHSREHGELSNYPATNTFPPVPVNPPWMQQQYVPQQPPFQPVQDGKSWMQQYAPQPPLQPGQDGKSYQGFHQYLPPQAFHPFYAPSYGYPSLPYPPQAPTSSVPYPTSHPAFMYGGTAPVRLPAVQSLHAQDESSDDSVPTKRIKSKRRAQKKKRMENDVRQRL